MDGKICTINNEGWDFGALIFDVDETGLEFLVCAEKLSGRKYGIWRSAYQKLEEGIPLETVMQDIVAHTLGEIFSKALEEKNGSNNLRRENDLRAIQLHTEEV